MNDLTDQQLLRDYAEKRTETAFAEVVRRYVDLVYSAAWRMIGDAQLAEDITQGVFVACAREAGKLTAHPVLAGWLHTTTRNLAANMMRAENRRRVREEEAVAMNELLADNSDAVWENIGPQLDEALGQLSEADRHALILRFFQRQSAREIGQVLGISDEAAQKRVHRAIEHLRELFAQRGLTAGVAGLTAAIATHSVQAAPAGLVAKISAATALTVGALTTTTITKTIAMTTLQKSLLTVTVCATLGAGFYEARQTSRQQEKLRVAENQNAPLLEQVKRLTGERDEAQKALVVLREENQRLNSNAGELAKLRNEVGGLRAAQQSSAAGKNSKALDPNDPGIQNYLKTKAKAEEIARRLQQNPEKYIPEVALMTDVDWLTAVKTAKFETDEDVRKTLQRVRSLAKERLPLAEALSSYIQENNGALPSEMSQLKPYVKNNLQSEKEIDDRTMDSILNRYKLLATGNLSNAPKDGWIIVEKAPVDRDYDSRIKFGSGSRTMVDTGKGEASIEKDY